MNEQEYQKAHKHCRHNFEELRQSKLAGCFYCLRTFDPNTIKEWTDENYLDKPPTALCPHCEIDSVIGSASGYDLFPAFLKEMYSLAFERVYTPEQFKEHLEKYRQEIVAEAIANNEPICSGCNYPEFHPRHARYCLEKL
jgi:hypothetical protein